MSNFTDFNALERMQGVKLRYVEKVQQLGRPDLILLPGTKNTMGDLKWLRMNGLEASVLKLAAEGTLVMGICGGYQMLGLTLEDPDGVEEGGSMRGMELLPVHTVFEKAKTRTRVSGKTGTLHGPWQLLSGTAFEGYEIHMGETTYEPGGTVFSAIAETVGTQHVDEAMANGCQYQNAAGSYVHGLFDSVEMQKALLRLLCQKKGLPEEAVSWIDEKVYKEQQYDKLAEGLRENMDMAKIYQILEEGELGDRVFDSLQEPIIKRAIHTSADFEYADSLCFSEHAVEKALDALRKGAYIVTDTQMGKSGINKKVMAEFGGEVCCFMSDPDVAETAKKNGTTRAVASMEKAAKLDRPLVFAIGNAPTALIQLYEMIQEGRIRPELIIGVPVGFVNVVQAKELIMTAGVPYIVARGRKGGSNIAAAICNALLYMLDSSRGQR